MSKELKILILGDLHGDQVKLYFKDFDAIILPGDICGDSPKLFHFESLRDKLAGKKQRPWFEICGKEKAKIMVEEDIAKGRKTLEFLNSLGKPVFACAGNWDYVDEFLPWDTGYFHKDWDFLNRNIFNDLIKNLENVKPLHLSLIHI